MIRKLLCLLLLLPVTALAAGLEVTPVEGVLHPGRAVILSFTAEDSGEADILLTDDAGETVSAVSEGFAAADGLNQLYWNGTSQGENAPEGEWQLTVRLDGEEASVPVIIGEPVPCILSFDQSDTELTPEGLLTLEWQAGEPARAILTLVTEDASVTLNDAECTAGYNVLDITGKALLTAAEEAGVILTDGDVSLTLMLDGGDDLTSTVEYLDLELIGFDGVSAADIADETPEEADTETEESTAEYTAATAHLALAASAKSQRDFTPSWTSPYPDDGSTVTYWNTPMDITDEARIWEMLTSPMTYLHTKNDSAEKRQVVIREEPNDKAKGVGVVTCMTQGVRVLSGDEGGWTKIECYSSSFHDSSVKAWNMLVQGWVPSSYLRTVKPNQEYGIVIDKLSQRLYLFKDGHLFSTLLVSTGLSNERQPYNETRSGEFILTSKVGEFRSDNLFCSLAIRFNSGDLLHEVPHNKNADGTKNYKNNEPKLGVRASHGCIRVQRKRTPQGVNMQYLWNNLGRNTRLVIWEDWQGRQLTYPADDTVLYYNSNGGTMYHTASTCYSTKPEVVFTETFTYAQLDEAPYSKLKTCDYCTPPVRKAVIDEINAAHAVGGDHDPVITEAREKFLRGEYDEKR